jgi:hypothetical protein
VPAGVGDDSKDELTLHGCKRRIPDEKLLAHNLLGNARTDKILFSPVYRIPYQANGFNRPRHKLLNKGMAWLENKACEPHLAGQLLDIHEQMTRDLFDDERPEDPDAIGRLIDEAFLHARQRHINCGGALASRAMTLNPRSIMVTVMPNRFDCCGRPAPVAGMARYGDERVIKVAVAVINGAISQPGRAWFQSIKPLLEWEFANMFNMHAGIDEEIGWESPCGRK